MSLTIADIVTRNVLTITPETTIATAADLMASHQISCIVAVIEGRPVSLVTEADLVRAGSLQLDVDRIMVGEFITHPPVTVSVNQSIYEAFDFLIDHHIRHLVTVTPDGLLDGLVTFTDMIQAVSMDDFMKAKLVEEEMSDHVVTIGLDASVLDAMTQMNRKGISCVIIEQEQQPVGIFTERDSAKMIASHCQLATVPVAGVMTSPLVTLPVGSSLLEASEMMRNAGIRRVVVTATDGSTAGILTQFDVIRGLEARRISHFKKLHARTEQQLIKSQQLLVEKAELERIVSISPAVLYRCEYHADTDGGRWVPTYFSPKIRTMLGYCDEEWRQPGWWQAHIHPDDIDAVSRCLQSILQSGEQDLTYRLRSKSGAWVWILDHARVITDTQNHPIEMVGSWLDVTRNQLAAQELQSSRQRLEAILNTVSDSIFMKDEAGRYLFCNSMVERVYGRPKESIIGRTDAELVDPVLAARFAEHDRQAMQETGPIVNEEHVIFADDGHEVCLETVKTAVHDESGAIIGVLGVARDITAYRTAQHQLELSEKKYRSLFDDALDMIHITDAEGRITDMNRAELERFGYEYYELVGRSILELVAPDCRSACIMAVGKVLSGQPFSGYETVFQTRSGEPVHVEIAATPQFDADGKVIAARAIMHDISARKQVEEKLSAALDQAEGDRAALQAMLNNLPFIAWLKDRHGRFLAVNEQFARLCGVADAAAVTGKSDFDLWPRPMAEGYLDDDREVMESGCSKTVHEQVMQPDGSSRWFETYKSPIFDAGGQVSGTAGMARDISDMLTAECERKAYGERLKMHQKSIVSVASVPQSVPLTEKMQVICELVASTLKADRVSIWLLSDHGRSLVCRNLYEQDRQSHSDGMALAAADYPAYFAALTDGRAIDASDACSDPRTSEFADSYLKPLDIVSMLDSAIRLEGKVAGVLCCEHISAQRQWFADEVAFVADMATQVSLAIQESGMLKTMEALKISEGKLKALVQAVPDLIWLKDQDGVYLGCNTRFEQFFGASEAEIVGKTDFDYVNSELAEFFRLNDREAMAAGVPRMNEEWVTFASDGHRALLETVKTPMRDDTGHIVGVLGVGRDITQRVRNEEQMRLLESAVAAVNESIIITDADGVVVYVNPAFVENSGYSAEEALGRKPPILSCMEKTPEIYRQFWDTLQQGMPWSGRMLDHRRDGTIFPVYLSVAPIFNEREETTHFVVVHEDLSTSEELQKKMMQSQKMESIGVMAGGIAHDFNNLLAGLIGNLYLLRMRHKEDREIVKRTREMESTIQHGAKMIQQMLTFARKDRPEMVEMDLRTFIKEAYKLALASLPENIASRLEYPEKGGVWVRGDATQLQQVLLNLVTNARHAVHDVESPEISIQLSLDAPDALPEVSGDGHVQAWCCVRCTDNGCGIAGEHLEHIFDPFFTTRAVGEGTGLGLAMVYGAVQNHGGVIHVDSHEGQGTTISVYLPLSEAGVARQSSTVDAQVNGQGKGLLLVDDEEKLRKVLAEVLRHNGFSVREAHDGEQAVEMYRRYRHEIDLVLMDVVMPNKGGVAAASEIRCMDEHVPIIFQTGYGESTQMEAARAISHSESLQKPVKIPELLQLIQATIGQGSAD
ncbi:PAS domain S-box protein [Mariprofundus erugo]|uniref:PAS domain S-box protein n=1 Tax=Mariprofundus erugo TaxID=2528639 RepID=UPI0010FE2151|nr:PAS domain S-box protein [Mariprofundus erugo]TLS75976.1 PAS domain S-box protein [Mariprofundus erugo]